MINRLILENTSRLYCKSCYYIVAVVADILTESTLYFGD